jgi:hypothetical protein
MRASHELHDASNRTMEPTVSRRTIQLSGSFSRQFSATRALIRSHPLTYRYPGGWSVHVALPQTAPLMPSLPARLPFGLFVYVAAPQLAPFARGGSSCSR